MIRRRKTTVGVRARWASTLPGRFLNTQAAMAAITPRTERIIALLGLARGRRYVDLGCGTAAYAHLLARRAGLEEAPLTLDIATGHGPLDALAWPEHLPLRDESVDCLTSLYFIHRFDDDVVHALGGEISRVLAPGGTALLLDIGPVRNERIERIHRWLLSPGCAEVDLRGWGRLAALFTECGFDAIDLVNVGPFVFPPVPRIGVLLRRSGTP